MSAPAAKPSKSKRVTSSKASSKQPVFLFGKKNYYLMFIGLGLIILGFLLMTGAKVSDHNVFDRSETYSFRRITLAPILIIAGFVVEVFAIMKKPKSDLPNPSKSA